MLRRDQGVIVDGIGYGIIYDVAVTNDAIIHYLVNFDGCSEMDDWYNEDEVKEL